MVSVMTTAFYHRTHRRFLINSRNRVQKSFFLSLRGLKLVIYLSAGLLLWAHGFLWYHSELSFTLPTTKHQQPQYYQYKRPSSASFSTDYTIRKLCEDDENGNPNDNNNSVQNSCAPWLDTLNQRRVIFLSGGGRFPTWQQYHNGQARLGGESYWAASLQILLESLNFTVVTQREPLGSLEWQRRAIQRQRSNHNNKNNNSDEDVVPYHRIIADCNADYTRAALFHAPTMCKVRQLRWFPLRADEPDGQPCQLSVFQPPPGIRTTWIPFLVHSQVLPMEEANQIRSRQPPYHAFLLSKDCAFDPTLVDALLQLPLQLQLHATCFRGQAYQLYFRHKIQNHGKLTPLQFAHLMRRVHLVIGFGKPLDSPTAFDAVANGAVFVNPLFDNNSNNNNNNSNSNINSTNPSLRIMDSTEVPLSQNDRLREIVGEPYVYNYQMHSNNTRRTQESLLATVQRALQSLPRRGFIAPEQSVCQLRQRVCRDLIENDDMCQSISESLSFLQQQSLQPFPPALPMCLTTCGKRVRGLARDQYQPDLQRIRDLLCRGDYDTLDAISHDTDNHNY